MGDNLTIVGPEPSCGAGEKRSGRVNIEALLLMAKYDDEFRRLLLADRERAITESGIEFRPSERLILMNASRDNLESGIREFSLPGVTRESLSSWREAAAVILLLLTLMVGDVSCSGMPMGSSDPGVRCPAAVSEADMASFNDGWCGNDAFRLKASGVPAKTASGIDSRKDTAMKAAVLIAQVRIMEKFMGSCISGTGIMYNELADDGSSRWKEELKDVVKKGTMVAASWDADQNCSVIYEVKKTGLKEWVQSCY